MTADPNLDSVISKNDFENMFAMGKKVVSRFHSSIFRMIWKIFFNIFFQLVLKEPSNQVQNLETKDPANPVQILIKPVLWEVGKLVNVNVEMGTKCFRESKLKNPQCGNCRNLFSPFLRKKSVKSTHLSTYFQIVLKAIFPKWE